MPNSSRISQTLGVDSGVTFRKTAHYVTKVCAGHRAIRETIELILKAKGICEVMIDEARG